MGIDPRRRLGAELGATGVFHCDTSLGDDTALDLPELPGSVMFHLVLAGGCRVESAGATEQLGPGAGALVPHGRGHRIVAGDGGRVVTLEDTRRPVVGDIVERLDLGGPASTRVICGALTLQHPAAPALPATLPPLLVVRPTDDAWGAMPHLVDLVRREAAAGEPGWVEIVSRLVDVVALRAIRAALTGHEPSGVVVGLAGSATRRRPSGGGRRPLDSLDAPASRPDRRHVADGVRRAVPSAGRGGPDDVGDAVPDGRRPAPPRRGREGLDGRPPRRLRLRRRVPAGVRSGRRGHPGGGTAPRHIRTLAFIIVR